MSYILDRILYMHDTLVAVLPDHLLTLTLLLTLDDQRSPGRGWNQRGSVSIRRCGAWRSDRRPRPVFSNCCRRHGSATQSNFRPSQLDHPRRSPIESSRWPAISILRSLSQRLRKGPRIYSFSSTSGTRSTAASRRLPWHHVDQRHWVRRLTSRHHSIQDLQRSSRPRMPPHWANADRRPGSYRPRSPRSCLHRLRQGALDTLGYGERGVGNASVAFVSRVVQLLGVLAFLWP